MLKKMYNNMVCYLQSERMKTYEKEERFTSYPCTYHRSIA